MKGILLGFLMLVMLTPSLACAMPVCADSPQEIQATPCADHAAGPETKKSRDTVKLVIDCMGVDMQAADHQTSLTKPDAGADLIVYALAEKILPPRPGDAEPKILGPPPDSPASSETHPSILLTTKRFRL